MTDWDVDQIKRMLKKKSQDFFERNKQKKIAIVLASQQSSLKETHRAGGALLMGLGRL